MTARIRAHSGIAAVLLLAAGLMPARLEGVLVVFDDGRHLHAESFELKDERVTINLAGGGLIAVALERVERIVDDEYERLPPEPPPGKKLPPERGTSVRQQVIPASLMSMPFFPYIREASEKYRIDASLIAAVIRAESGFQPYAVSRKGARGLMQLMPSTARRLGVSQAFDPRQNVHGGVSYLSELARRFGEFDVDRILAAYNAGEAAVEEYDGIPPYRETQNYVRKVKGLWKEYLGAAVKPASAASEPPGEGKPGR